MAKISIYSPQITVPVVRAALARPNQTGEVIASQAERIADAWDRKARQDANVFAATEASRLRLKYRQQITKDYNSGAIASGYTGTNAEAYQADQAEVLSRAPNRYASELAGIALADVQGDVDEQSMRYEAEANISNKALNLDNVIDNYASLAAMPGTSLEQTRAFVAKADMATAGSGIPTKMSNARIETSRKKIGESYASGMAENNPEQLIKDINSGKMNGLIDPQQMGAFVNRAQTTINQREADGKAKKAEVDQQLRKDAEDALALVEMGKPLGDVIQQLPGADPAVQRASGNGDVAALIEGTEFVRTAKDGARRQTPEERARSKQVAVERVTKGDPTEAAGAQRAAVLEIKAIQEVEDELEKNPWAAAQADLVTQNRMNDLNVAAATGVSGTELDAIARSASTAAVAAQIKSGVRPEFVMAVDKESAKSFAIRLEDAQGSERLDLLSNLQRQYGDNFKYIRRQLRETFSNQPLLAGILSLPNTEEAKQVAATLDVNRADLEKELEKSVPKDINVLITDNARFQSYTAAMVRRPSNDAQLDAIKNVTRLAAMSFVRQGMEPEAAVEKAAAAYFSGYTYTHSQAGRGSEIRLPAAMAAQADAIKRGTYAALHDPQVKHAGLDNITESGNTRFKTKEDYVKAVKRNGRWVSSADGAGAFLYDGDDYVVKSGGKEVFLTWAQLISASRQTFVPAPSSREMPPDEFEEKLFRDMGRR